MKTVKVTTKQAALHNWPNAPDFVDFLRHPHRHLFGISVEVSVEHSDRDVEFFTLLNDVQHALTYLGDTYKEHVSLLDFGSKSCEMLAEQLKMHLTQYHVLNVIISEDDESFGSFS